MSSSKFGQGAPGGEVRLDYGRIDRWRSRCSMICQGGGGSPVANAVGGSLQRFDQSVRMNNSDDAVRGYLQTAANELTAAANSMTPSDCSAGQTEFCQALDAELDQYSAAYAQVVHELFANVLGCIYPSVTINSRTGGMISQFVNNVAGLAARFGLQPLTQPAAIQLRAQLATPFIWYGGLALRGVGESKEMESFPRRLAFVRQTVLAACCGLAGSAPAPSQLDVLRDLANEARAIAG